ncbi:hypothetical protein ABZ934_02045 [Streptomyces sp. NPDC046557]|uniref:hypothetical protein n=1 Tax=Streptomyces sp. NPDC046557 TaxID=3155372 RepID=UPI0034058808
MKKRLVLAGSAVVASLGLGIAAVPAVAQPLTLNVRCGDIAGLITAVTQANSNPDGGTISLAHRCVYRFTAGIGDSALPPITSRVTIKGEDSTLMRSTVVPGFRLLNVAPTGYLTLKGIVVNGGNSDNGGGIYNAGTLLLEDTTVSGNHAALNGGGIFNNNGHVTAVDSRILNNIAVTLQGGGLYNSTNGNVTLKKTTVAGNTANTDGGGVENGGTLRVLDHSVFTHNEAFEHDGGAIDNDGITTISDSRFIANWADYDGGAVNNTPGASLEARETVFELNKAGRDGGAINNLGVATLERIKVEKNSAGRDGGGINNGPASARVPAIRLTLTRSLVVENRAAEDGGGINNALNALVELRDTKLNHNLPTNCAGNVAHCVG